MNASKAFSYTNSDWRTETKNLLQKREGRLAREEYYFIAGHLAEKAFLADHRA